MVKRAAILLMILSAVVLCRAQLPTQGDWSKRLGTIDQQKAKDLFAAVFSKTSPLNGGSDTLDTEFYIKLKQLMSLAPFSDYTFYSGGLYEAPNSVYRLLLDRNSDPAVRVMLVEDVVEQGKMYVDHLDSINVIRELNPTTKGNPFTMPLAKIKRAHYNYMFAHNQKYYPQHLYDKKKAYELYREGFKDFLAAKEEQGGKELEAFYVQEYYRVCEDLYKTDEDKYYEQFLSDYQEIVRVCDKLLVPCYDDPDSLKEFSQDEKYVQYRNYRGAVYGVNVETGDTVGVKLLFEKSGAGSAEMLKKYFAPRLEPNKQNKEFLDNAISFMYANNLRTDTILYDYCKASYELGKTYENCIGLANSAYIGLIDKTEMRSYYMDALQMASSDVLKAKISFFIARSLYNDRPKDAEGNTYAKNTPEYLQWEKDIIACNANLAQMLVSSSDLLNDPSLDVRDYVAQAYYMLGQNHYLMAALNYSLDEAAMSVTNFQKAAQMNIRASRINGRPVNVEGRLNAVEDVRQRIKQKLKEAKANSKEAKAYEEYMRKKAIEEAFWKQGH